LAVQLRSEAQRDPSGSALARRYRDFARHARPGNPPRFVIDTSPANLRRIGFLSLLHPRVPIIFCRRDPLDLAVALYFKHFKTGHGYSYSLSAIGRAIARSEQLMAHWLRELPNPMATVHYEALARDPTGTIQAIGRALGIAIRVADPGITDGSAAAESESEWRLFTARSIDAHGSIRPDLIGFGERFSPHMQTAINAYKEESAHASRISL
ncbi:MAG: sulfotransferase, partial [Chromatocurvus sp.]